MYTHKIPNQQLTAWLVAAIVPAAIQLTAGASWLSVLLAAAVCLLCVCLRWSWGTELKGKLFVFLQWALIVAVLAAVSQLSVQSWPRGGHKAVAVILLALALWAAWKGPSASARVGSVLFWFVLGLYLVLLGAGIKEIEPRWLIPQKGDVSSLSCILLLTPAAAAIHLNKRERCKPRLLLIAALCTAAALVTAGVLSPQVASGKENAFYEMTRSLNLLGQARRFEAVLSAGMTAGWFTLMSLYLSLCARLAETFRPGWGRRGAAAAAVLAAVSALYELPIPGFLLLILTAVFWVALPLLAQVMDRIKKS